MHSLHVIALLKLVTSHCMSEPPVTLAEFVRSHRRAFNRRAVAVMPVPPVLELSACVVHPRVRYLCVCPVLIWAVPVSPDACLTVVNRTHFKLRRFAILYRQLEILHRQSHSQFPRSPDLVFLKPLCNLFFFFRTQRMFPKSLPFTSSDYRC